DGPLSNANHEYDDLPPPATIDGMDCIAVNVISERIPSAIQDSSERTEIFPQIFRSNSCMYAGVTSRFFRPTDSTISADLTIPAGASVFQILGFQGRNG